MSSGKCWPFCLGLNVLKKTSYITNTTAANGKKVARASAASILTKFAWINVLFLALGSITKMSAEEMDHLPCYLFEIL